MNLKNFILIFIASILASILRLFIDNNFIISVIGSFIYGFVVAKKLSKSINEILIIGFCSCFTSFTGFIFFVNKLFNQQDFIGIFIYLNIILISNLLMMYFGFRIGRKIT